MLPIYRPKSESAGQTIKNKSETGISQENWNRCISSKRVSVLILVFMLYSFQFGLNRSFSVNFLILPLTPISVVVLFYVYCELLWITDWWLQTICACAQKSDMKNTTFISHLCTEMSHKHTCGRSRAFIRAVKANRSPTVSFSSNATRMMRFNVDARSSTLPVHPRISTATPIAMVWCL